MEWAAVRAGSGVDATKLDMHCYVCRLDPQRDGHEEKPDMDSEGLLSVSHATPLVEDC